MVKLGAQQWTAFGDHGNLFSPEKGEHICWKQKRELGIVPQSFSHFFHNMLCKNVHGVIIGVQAGELELDKPVSSLAMWRERLGYYFLILSYCFW